MAYAQVSPESDPRVASRAHYEEQEKGEEVLKVMYGASSRRLPLVDIDCKWQGVALDALCAFLCGVPFLGILTGGYWLYHYSIIPAIHGIVAYHETSSKK